MKMKKRKKNGIIMKMGNDRWPSPEPHLDIFSAIFQSVKWRVGGHENGGIMKMITRISDILYPISSYRPISI
jgi:hypothetical protein